MATMPTLLLRLRYDKEALEYSRTLTVEDIMESPVQATQREITLASLALVKTRRPDFHLFNELLIQYPLPDDRIGKVVPDNMVVLYDGQLKIDNNFGIPIQPVRPFWVMEYVLERSEKKDYNDNLVIYEQEVKAPYYLIFHPEKQELILFKRVRSKYVSVRYNRKGRCPIPKLDLEVGLLDGWMRYWHKKELLPLPADMLQQLDEAKQQLADAKRLANEANRHAEDERQRRLQAEEELAQLREELEKLRRG